MGGNKKLLNRKSRFASYLGCLDMNKTRIRPNKNGNIVVSPKKIYLQSLELEFGSHAVEDASHPTCKINFNGTSYVLPDPMDMESNGLVLKSPLPGCFTGDSREGYHMTYYWFHLLEWNWK